MSTCQVYLVVVYIAFVRCQSYIGDLCTFRSTQESGTCQLLENCQVAIKALQNNVYPQNCGYQNNQPIVCCVGGSAASSAGIPLKLPSSQSATVTKRPPASIRPTAKPSVTAPKRPPASISLTPKPTVVAPKFPTASLKPQPNGPKKPQSTGARPSKVGDKSIQKCAEYGKFVNVLEYPPVNLPGSKPYLRSDCGVVEVPLIVGGELAKPKEFPHMALIGFDGEDNTRLWLCGGSLISEEYVLTAAHCYNNKDFGEPKYIRLGDLDHSITTDDAKPQEMNIRRFIQHPKFKPPSQYNDIALIQLDKKADLNPYVRPICLYTQKRLTTQHAIASGWGRTGYTADLSAKLMKVTLEYYSNAECNVTYKANIGPKLRNGILPDTQLCAGSHSASKDTCQGDSGGPLQVYNGDEVYCTYKLVGITSFGRSCGLVSGVYTLVSAYIDWVEKTVWP